MARGYINDKPISYSSLKTWLKLKKEKPRMILTGSNCSICAGTRSI